MKTIECEFVKLKKHFTISNLTWPLNSLITAFYVHTMGVRAVQSKLLKKANETIHSYLFKELHLGIMSKLFLLTIT